MSFVTQSYALDIIPFGAPVIIPVSQYDTGARTLSFTLVNSQSSVFDIPDGASALLGGTKPDGKAFLYTCTIDGNNVLCDVTEQMTAVAGYTECEITITKEGSKLATANFKIHVEKAAMEETAISESDFRYIVDLAAETADHVAETAASAKAAADSEAAAKKSEENAAASEKASKDSEGKAADSQKAAADSETNAASSEKNAADSAKLSESWTAGGTRVREGEDTDNAKYYATNAGSSATKAESYARGGTGSREGEDSDNSKYYSERSADYEKTAKYWTVGTEGTTETPSPTNNAKYYAQLAETFSTFNAPKFHIDFETMELIQDQAADHYEFMLDDNKNLLIQINM